ncbi:LytTR family DNA-binding domain-containing protein [Colwellia sp. RSH04]|uniref:LytR/AlgR family response regulator transcription factor n=1 Tax=Colwellia sp. RSH04 TaxID=2305464 RepID=UPI000E583A83|nr:LytTR family DNA-binding domain-containing protein [Colwellia sp. RSH04]RHW75507.1 DNA-binding response regulator [Colwellia sp. RSH04]
MNNIIIIEDEPHAAAHLTKRVEQLGCNVIAVYSQYSELLQWLTIKSKITVDILLLDIHVSDGNSFDLFQSGIALPEIVVTTAYPDYAIKAFEASCCDYLLKPFSDERLQQAILKAQNNIQNINYDKLPSKSSTVVNNRLPYKRILAKRGANTFPIKTELISYFYKAPLLQLVTHDNETYVHDITLDELMQRLNPKEFFRINRQWIVNIEAVITIKSLQQKKLSLTLSPNTEQSVIVSQDKVKAFKQWLGAG